MKSKLLKLTFPALATLIVYVQQAAACPWCRIQVKNEVYNQDFSINLFVLLLPILVFVAVGLAFYFKDEMTERFSKEIKNDD